MRPMADQPNILWICADQQRFDALGCNGNPFVHTPNIDALCAGGVNMRRMYAQSPVCAPSRASFLTGRYPRTCGVRQNGQDIPPTERLLPRLFCDAGYRCGLSGKLHLSACHPDVCPDMERRIDDGYSFFAWSHHPAAAGRGNWTGNAYTAFLTAQGVAYATPSHPDCRFIRTGMPAAYSQTKWCFDEAMRFIGQQKGDQPWFFSLNCFDPHHPFDPPAEYLARYLPILDQLPAPDYRPGELASKPVFQQKDHLGAYDTPGDFAYDDMTVRDRQYLTAAYYAMCDQIDDNVGRIVRHLKETGRYDNTIILYTADHGESLGDHGIYLKGPYCYENAVHVPCVLHWGNHFARGAQRHALAEMLDLAPTLCEAAGVPMYGGFQGRSFLRLLTNADAPDEHRQSVYAEYYNANINHRDPLAFLTMVLDGRWKLVKAHAREGAPELGGELYDLASDPGEHENLYADARFAAQRARLLALMCDRMAQSADPLPARRAYW